MTTLDELAAVAGDAARAGATYLREQFERANAAGADADDGVATGAERRILDTVADAYPDHPVDASETGDREGSGHYRWVVEPLDGASNFAAGLPTFATAVTVLADGDPAVAAVHLPVLDDAYLARRDGGVTYDGTPTTTGSDLEGREATVGFVVGHDAREDPEQLVMAGHLRNTLEVRTERVIECWSPTVHWALLTRGRVQGMVAYHPDPRGQYAGELLAAESGASTRRGADVYVAAASDRILAELADITEPVL